MIRYTREKYIIKNICREKIIVYSIEFICLLWLLLLCCCCCCSVVDVVLVLVLPSVGVGRYGFVLFLKQY